VTPGLAPLPLSGRADQPVAAPVGASDHAVSEGKARRLEARLRSLGSVLVAYSGGADSAFLAWAATRALGSRALCVTAESPSYPEHHRQLALRVAAVAGLRHEFVRTAEIEREEYRANPVNRCYYCKDELYSTLTAVARERGIAAIADGNNADDRGDYRPGRQAAREFGVISPLDEVDLTKDEIRTLSRAAGLPTWDEPASACLSSRIPYHSEVTPAKLRMIEAAETSIRALGFAVVRVRHEAAGARVEIGCAELSQALEPGTAERIVHAARAAGYDAVTIDPTGYRTGSLNEGLILRSV